MAVVLALGAVACGDGDTAVDVSGATTTTPQSTSPVGSADRLASRTWIATRISEDGAARPLVAGTQLTLTFDDGTAGGSAGCNSFGGDYHLDGDRLVVEEMSMTEMGCDPDRHTQDEWITGLLNTEPQWSVSGDELTITATGSGTETVIVFVDEEVAIPDRPLVDTDWELITVISGTGPEAAASSVPAGAEVSLRFAEDGTFEAELGCNSGGGSYELDGDVLRVVELGVEAALCSDVEVMALEEMVTELLTSEPHWEIDGDRLRLRTDDAGLEFGAAA